MNPRKLNKLLPLVAIGTIADCQSILQPTNRILVKSGLSVLNKNKSIFPNGLLEILNRTGLKEKMQNGYKLLSSDLGYTLSPILNSSGRISHAKLSISLLTENDETMAGLKAAELIQTNNERKKQVSEILNEVQAEATTQFQQEQKLLWLQGTWSKGLVGLLASKLVSLFELPVVVVSIKENPVGGSLRAPEGFNLPKIMKSAGKDLFLKFGGHPQAAGFSAELEKLENIKIAMQKAVKNPKNRPSSKKTSFIPTDYPFIPPKKLFMHRFKKNYLWIVPEQLSQKFLAEILSLEPFGQDFPQPKLIFPLENIKLKFFGENQTHYKLQAGGVMLTGFNLKQKMVDNLKELNSKKTQNLTWFVTKISQNNWRNQTNFELIVEELFLT